jgi:hypothetical protein
MKTFQFISCVAIIAALFSFCKKDQKTDPVTPAPTPYYVKMTDAPGPYTAVNVDIQSVEITGNGNTITLNTTPGIYNLLNFTNGVDTLIATGSLTIDKVQQIRLILGTNNSVVTSGTVYPLTVPSGAESGLKLQVHQDLQAGVAYEVLLDFDANKSIVQEGNGSYSLKPVIRTIETALSGAIKGKLSVAGVSAVITAGTGTLTYSTGPDANGDFIISGLPAGTYSLSVTPAAPYSSSTMTNVSVSTGVTTNVGVINI